MKLKSLLTTLAAAVGLTTAATAATPTVVWDRDFDTTTKTGTDGKTYTFAANGNGVENGIISVTQAYGATVTFPEQNANGYTVIIKYSNLSAISDRMPIFAGFATSYDGATDYGVAASEKGGLGLSGYWFESAKRYAFGTVPTLAEGSGYVVMSHKIGNNMKTYAGATLAEATGATCGLTFSSGNATAIGLGGASKDSSSATCGLTGWNNGLRIESVAIFAGQFYAATDVANYKFPSECGVLKNARWGNIGSTAGGIVSNNGGNFGYDDWTLNFSDSTGMYDKEIGGNGKVRITRIVLVDRPDASAQRRQSKIKLTQGDLSVEATPVYHAASTDGISIYDSNGKPTTGSNKSVFGWSEYVLTDNAVEFDTSADITIKLSSSTSGGTGVCAVKPANGKLVYNGWTPAIEITGDYTAARRSISINFGSGKGSVSGTYGIFPSSTWNNYSEGTYSGGKTANVSDGSTVTVKWWSSGIYQYTSVTDNALKGYLDDGACGDGMTSDGPHIGVIGIPFANYDVIIYHASDTSGYGFNPAAISEWTSQTSCGSTALSYDGLTSATRNDSSLKFGGTRNATAVFGKNVSYLKKGFGYANLDIKGGKNTNSARGGIAAIQIVEAFPSDYAASVDAATATWSTQDGLTAISGRPDGENTDSSTLTLSNTTQDDATVNFDTSAGYKTIAVTGASGKSTTLTGTVPAVSGNYEIGGLAKLTYVPNKPITILSGGKLTLANTTAGTQGEVISGDGALDIAGPVTLSKGNTFKGTMTVKNGGTLTMGSASCLNNGNAVTIEQGGVVDNNGQKDSCNNFTLAGGTLVNNGSEIGLGSMQMASVTVTADSTIGGTGNFGLLNSGYGATTLTLNEGKTLTKTGANSFWLLTTTVNGTGKLAIKQGTVNCANKGSGSVNFQNATVELDGGNLEVNKAATLKNLSYKSGTLKANAAISGLTDISGNFDTTSSSCLSGSGALGFADAVAFHDGTIRLNESILTTLGTTKTVTIGDNGILDIRAARAIKITSIGTDAKLAVKQQASETETITVTDTTLEDGDYLAKVQVIEAEDDAVLMPLKSAAVSGGTLTITLDKTVFTYTVTGDTTISAIETAVLGEGKTFEEAAQLTITATDNPTITVDKNLHITKFALVGAATLKFNDGMTITAPTISAENTVTIDCTGITAGEHTYFVGAIADTSKFTASNVPEGQGIYVTASGVSVRKADTGTRTNPVTGETADFTKIFFGTADGDWANQENWRTLTTLGDAKLWTPYTELGMAKAPALKDHGSCNAWRVLFDGDYATEKTITSTENAEGWAVEFAFLNGVDVTFGLNKVKCDSGSMFIWVDGTSTATINNSVTGQRGGTVNLYIANQNGLTFSEAWNGGSNAFNYYLNGVGTVNYAAGVTAGTHKIAQMDLTVGETAKDCRHVAKQKLVNFGASSSVTFSAADGIVVNLDNAGVTATYIDTVPACTNEVGVYTIATESDGVYAYVVQYADAWDIVDPLSATLTANAKFSEITTWTDFYGHAGADLTKAHAYKLTAGEFTATLDAAPADGSSIELVSGTLVLDDAEVIAAGTSITVDADATLSVTASGLTASKVTNNGTIAFAGGTADAPIAITGDADFGVVTLAADTFVKNTETTNHKHLVTGAGATSYYQMWRDGETGFSDGSALANLTLVVNNTIWLERVTLTEESNVYLEANAQVILNQINPVICGLSGSGSLTHYSSGNPTICCKQASTYSGISALAFTIGGTEVQTLSGNYTGALTVNEGATVKLAGSANPTSISGAGTVILAYDGECTFTSDLSGFTGTIEVDASVTTLDVDTKRPTATFKFSGEAPVVKFTEKVADDGVVPSLTLAEGSATPVVKVIGVNGAEKEISGGKYTPTVTGKAAIRAYEFNGDLSNSGNDGTGNLGKDNGPFYKDDTEVFALTQPYNTITWPTEFTVAIHATLPDLQNACLIAWGTRDAGGIGLTTGDPTHNEVKMVYWPNNTAYTALATMTVPNAQTIKHLYVFTKTADTLKIYLDGSLVVNYSGAYSLGGGFQVGSVHGGIGSTGLGRLDQVYKTTTDTNACYSVINSMRIYDTVLGANAMAELVKEFPYESPNGTFTRALEGTDNQWVAEDAWTKVGEEEKYDAPTAEATVNLTAADAATVTLNLESPIDFEAMNFTGEGTITIAAAADNTNKVSCSGTATFGANAEIDYSAMTLAGTPITIAPEKTLTIDASMIDLATYFVDTTITLTGLVNADDAANQLKCTLPETVDGRTVTFVKNEANNTYELKITVAARPFVYTIAKDAETGTWTFGETEETVTQEIVDAYPDIEIWKKGDGSMTNVVINRTYVVKEGTMVAGDAANKTGTVTVDGMATFDFNGQKDGYTTINLNGGSLVNNGGEMGTGSRQMNGIALTENSTIGGTDNFGLISGGWGANTLNLGGKTLTKIDTNTFWLTHTTVTNGTLNVTGGTIKPTGSEVTFTSDAALVLTQGTTLDNATTLTIGAITASEATINNTGTITPFTLTGSATLTGNGTWGTITNATGAAATIGTKRDFTFAGEGTVNVTLTDEEYKKGHGTAKTMFTVAEGSVKVGTIMYGGKDVTSQCTISGGTITVTKIPLMFIVK